MNWTFWRRRATPQAPLNADFNLRAVTVTIPFLGNEELGSIVPLLEKKMDSAARSMSEMLNAQLWPKPAWYWRVWGRVSAAALVLAGKRYSRTAQVAFHDCPERYEDEE